MIGVLKIILGIIFAPWVTMAAISMALDMAGIKRKRRRRRKRW